MFVYTIRDVFSLIVYGLLALIVIAVLVFDKKDDSNDEKAERITLKSMFGRLFAERVKDKIVVGWDADGGYLEQGHCPRCGIILTDGCKRCPKCWQRLRW